jgi:integrase
MVWISTLASEWLKARTVTVSPTTIDALKQHRKEQMKSLRGCELVFPDLDGGFLRRRNFNGRNLAKAMKRAGAQSGLDFTGHTFHDLCHTCASLLLKDGVDIVEVSRRLGHSKPSTTWNTYAHCLPENNDKAAQSFEKAISSPISSPSVTASA